MLYTRITTFMDLNDYLKQIADKASHIQSLIDTKESWFDEPHQSIYLYVTDILDLCEENQAKIDSLSNEGVNLDPALHAARQLYDDYKEKIPYFLSEGGTNYFLIKSYYSVCFQLIKSLSYSTHDSDKQKISPLKQWITSLDKAEKSMDAGDSVEASLDFIRPLHPFESMPTDSYAQFQEEVKNIQSLLSSNPELETSIEADDLSLIAEASTFLTENPHLFESLQFEEQVIEFEQEPLHEVVAERCHQLSVFLDDFKDQFGIFKKVKDMHYLLNALNEQFDLSINVCNDINTSIQNEIGSHKSPTVKKLCKMMLSGLANSCEESWLQNTYPSLDIGYLIGRWDTY